MIALDTNVLVRYLVEDDARQAAAAASFIARSIAEGEGLFVSDIVVCETVWHTFRLSGEPPMTRFVAAELAKDHLFDLGAARRDLGYTPRVSMAAGMAELVAALKK